MKTAIYFEVDYDLKKKFNISLAKKEETKTKVLTDMILKYIKEDEDGSSNS